MDATNLAKLDDSIAQTLLGDLQLALGVKYGRHRYKTDRI